MRELDNKEILVLKQCKKGFILKRKKHNIKLKISKGIIKNKLTKRELRFVMANLPEYYFKYKKTVKSYLESL